VAVTEVELAIEPTTRLVAARMTLTPMPATVMRRARR